MTPLYVLNIVSAGYACLMAIFLLRNTGDRWSTAEGAAVNGLAVLALLYLSVFAVVS